MVYLKNTGWQSILTMQQTIWILDQFTRAPLRWESPILRSCDVASVHKRLITVADKGTLSNDKFVRLPDCQAGYGTEIRLKWTMVQNSMKSRQIAWISYPFISLTKISSPRAQKWANDWAQQSACAKRAVRSKWVVRANEQTYEQMAQYLWIFDCSVPTC